MNRNHVKKTLSVCKKNKLNCRIHWLDQEGNLENDIPTQPVDYIMINGEGIPSFSAGSIQELKEKLTRYGIEIDDTPHTHKLPEGLAWGSKYEDKPDIVAVFPEKFKDVDINDLPLEKVDWYGWGEEFEKGKWEVQDFHKNSGHSGLKMRGTKEMVKKELLCEAKAFSNRQESREFLEKCRKTYGLKDKDYLN